jgi:hypothetical protein
MQSYSKKLKHPSWQKKRLEILTRDEWTCQMCNDTETTLHVHHLSYEYRKEPWEYPNENLVTLCEHCHFEVEKENFKIDDQPVSICKEEDNLGNRMMYMHHHCSGQFYVKSYDANNQLVVNHQIDGERLLKVLNIYTLI